MFDGVDEAQIREVFSPTGEADHGKGNETMWKLGFVASVVAGALLAAIGARGGAVPAPAHSPGSNTDDADAQPRWRRPA